MPVKSSKSFGVKALGQGLGADGEKKDAEFNQVTTLLHADGSEGAGDTAELGTPNYKAFIDNSTSDHAIAINADAYGNNFSPYTLADGYWSTTFDGNANNHIRYQGYRENDMFNLDDRNKWCVDFWVFVFNNAVAFQRIAEMYNASNYWAIKFNSTGNGKLCIGSTDASNNGILETGSAIPEGRWVHVALTNDGDRLRWLVDGKLSAITASGWTQPWANNTSLTTHSQLQLCNYRYVNGYQLRGSINNFRIVQGSIPSEFETQSTSADSTIFSVPTTPTADPFVEGYLSNFFDGSGDYLSIASDSALTISTNDFTIEFWTYVNTKTDYTTFYDQGYTGGNALLLQSNNNASDIRVFMNGSVAFTSSSQIPLREWTHVALVRISGVVTLYFNGSSVGTANKTTNLAQYAVQIGRGQTSHYLDGYLSNFRVVVGSGLYSSSFTPSDVPFTTTSQSATASEVKLLTCRSKRFVDNSSTAIRTKQNGEMIASEFHPFNDGYWSAYFDGNGDYLTIPYNADFAFGSGDFTVEGWVKTVGVNGQYGTLVGRWNNNNWDLRAYSQDIGHRIMFALRTGSTNTLIDSGQDIRDDGWHHVVAMRSGSYIYIGLDGSIVKTQYYTGTINDDGTTALTVAKNSVNVYKGYISNVRIIKGSAIYSTSGYTVPTSPLTQTSQGATASEVKFLGCQSNRFIDNSSSARTITPSGNSTVHDDIPFRLLSRQTRILTCRSSTHQDIIPDRFHYNAGKTVSVTAAVPFITPNSPFSYTSPDNVGSGYFDGANDGLTTATDSDFAFGTGNFTFECWVYPKTAITSGTKVILDLRYANTGATDQLSALVWTGQRLDNYSGANFSSDTDLARVFHEGTWNHICVQRIGDVLYHSVNGYMSSYNPAFTRNLSGNGKVTLGGNEGLTQSMFTGYIADMRVTATAVYGAKNFDPPTSSLSALSNTKFLTCQYSGAVRNQGITDESKWRHRLTRFGDTKIGTFSPFSLEDGYWSWYFDGNNPVEIADANSGLDLPGDFTVEFWVYEPKLATTNGTVNMYFTIDTLDRFQVGNNGSNLFVYMNGGNTVNGTTSPLGQWNHIAIVRSGSGSNNVSIYRNGSRLGQGTNTTSLAAGSLMLGGQDRGGTTGYHGSFMYMSNFRILKGTALYSGTSYTVPSSPLTAITNTSLLTCQSHRFRDNSTNNMTHTTYYTEVQAFSPFAPSRSYSKDAVGGSIHLDGTGDWVQINANKDINVLNPSTTYTLEGWFYVDIDTAGTRYIIAKGGTGTGWSVASSHYLLLFLYNNSIYIQVKTGTGSFLQILGAHGPSYQWNHFAVGYDGTTHRMWYNGSSIGTSTTTPVGDVSTNGQNMFIGVSNNGSTSPFAGYISNIRYVRGTDVYGVSNASITVPTAPPTNIANTNLLTNFTNGAIIDHSMKNNLETEGNTRIRTDIKKYGTGSIFFDGVSDVMVQRKGRMTLNFNTEKFTIEFWCLVPSDASTASLQMFVSTEGGSWSGGAISWYTAYSANSYVFPMFVADYSGGAPMLNAGTTSLKDGTWHHHAVVRGASGACAYFLDGTRKSTATFTGNVGSATRDAVFGGLGTSSRNSKFFLDDFRVTKGVARYDPSQTSVTIPTSAFANR